MNDAFYPWLPTLQDIEARKDHFTDEGRYYEKFGWEQLEVPADCPHVSSRMGDLKVLFDERYAFRMINSETLEQWQIRLQSRFDRYVHIYERAYVLYETYQQDMLDDMKGGEARTITRSGSEIGSGSESGDVRNINTPDSRVNANDDYADSRSKSSGSSSSNVTTSESISDVLIKTGEGIIDNINSGFRKYVDIDQDFIRQFEDSFLNLFWY